MKSTKASNKVIHITVNDSDCYEDERINEFVDDIFDNQLSLKMNIVVTMIDMTQFYLITTTIQDLEEQHLEFLKSEIDDGSKDSYPFIQQLYPEYDPSIWCANKNFRYFGEDDIFYKLYLFVDGLGREIMCNQYPQRLMPYMIGLKEKHMDDLYNEITEYYKDNNILDCDYFNTYTYNKDKTKRNIPVLKNYTVLPKGFIEKFTGKKLDIFGNPIQWTPIPYEELHPYDCRHDIIPE